MIRTVEGFHQDAEGDWVAELSCFHGQHVRHRPPFFDRPWVLTEDGRRQHIGQPLDCPLCDRAELPDGLHVVRTAGPFDDNDVPSGLRRDHRIADHTWAVLRILDGGARFTMEGLDRTLAQGDEQPVPPGILHALHIDGPVRLEIDFLTR